jgi:hypothetical protein
VGLSNHFPLETGELLPEEQVRAEMERFLARNFGEDAKFTIVVRGINYHFSSNVDQQLYTYDLTRVGSGDSKQKEGDSYRVYMDARTGQLFSLHSSQ